MHPLTRQSQLRDFESFTSSNWSVKTKPEMLAIEAVLDPGDILLIPAFYFHHVRVLPFESPSQRIFTRENKEFQGLEYSTESLGLFLSVSAAFYQPTPQKEIFGEIFRLPLPFHSVVCHQSTRTSRVY